MSGFDWTLLKIFTKQFGWTLIMCCAIKLCQNFGNISVPILTRKKVSINFKPVYSNCIRSIKNFNAFWIEFVQWKHYAISTIQFIVNEMNWTCLKICWKLIYSHNCRQILPKTFIHSITFRSRYSQTVTKRPVSDIWGKKFVCNRQRVSIDNKKNIVHDKKKMIFFY